MPPRAVAVTDAQQAQAEPEVRVVVDRVELDRALELGRGLTVPAAPEVRPSERLSDGSLLRLECTGALQRDRRRVRVA